MKDSAATTATVTTKKITTTAADDVDEDDNGEEEGEGVPANPESPTPAPKTTGKKHGRPVGSTKAAKKAKVNEEA